ncbi:hypothetical protein F0U61_10670 [Archangium violaceum]|uniref:hypothetical protein n=1 Tax=Archangium violaceum TaxID=83451 RepID=UPI002B2E3FB1|nr:hypothetical protein F0U61_10670 [Archangium violaceum]
MTKNIVGTDGTVPGTNGSIPVLPGDPNSSQHENCLVPKVDFTGDGVLDDIPPRTQMLIYRGATLRGICTVAGSSPDNNKIFMTKQGFTNRVDIDADMEPDKSGEEFVLDDDGVNTETGTTLEPAELRVGSSFRLPVESTADSAKLTTGSANSVIELYKTQAAPKVLYAWPHLMENGTYAQFEALDKAPGTRNWETFWAASFNNAGRHQYEFERFHITSTNLGTSWPGLAKHINPASARFPYAVSFHTHGRSCSSRVAVRVGGQNGGDAGSQRERVMHQGIAEIIRMAIPDDALTLDPQQVDECKDLEPGECKRRITFATGDCFNGGEEGNFVNAVTAFDNGIQLEQHFGFISGSAQGNGTIVAQAVRSVFDCLAEEPDASLAITGSIPAVKAFSSGTTYATNGLCPGFIFDLSVSTFSPYQYAMAQIMEGAAIQKCAENKGENGVAHVDYYRLEVAATGQKRWRRIGGGRIDYDNACKPGMKVLNLEGEWEAVAGGLFPQSSDALVPNHATASFRTVMRAYRQDGTPLPVEVLAIRVP